MAVEPSAKTLLEIDAALAHQQFFEAIRLFREATQMSVAEARAFVEARRAILTTSSSIPAEVERYLQSGYAKAGTLLGWWRNPLGDFCVLVRYTTEPKPLFEIGVFPSVVSNWGHQLNGVLCDLAQLRLALEGSGFAGADWGAENAVVASIRTALSAPKIAPAQAAVPPASTSGSAVMMLDSERFERDWLLLAQQIDVLWWEPRRQRIVADSEIAELGGDIASLWQQPQERPFTCPLSAGALLWSLCHGECAFSGALAESSDSLFADLEARPPEWQKLAPAELPAWNVFLAIVDISARRRSFLPWWLQAAATQRAASVGLLNPIECRQLARCAARLDALFEAHPAQADVRALLQLCERAAAQGCWLLGWEAAG